MELTTHVKEISLTRQERLEVWIKRNDASYAALGRCMGLSRGGARYLFLSDTAPADRVEQMRKIRVKGQPIPEDLLPEPVNVRRGPKPKTGISMASA